MKNHTLNSAVFTANPNDQPIPPHDPNSLFTGGAFLPDPTPGADQTRRGVQLIGIGSDDSLIITILYLRPRSCGFIKIQSDDPLQIVLADEAFLEDPADLEAVKTFTRSKLKT